MAHANTWTRAGGLQESVNGVSSNIAIPQGVITSAIGYDAAGDPVYSPKQQRFMFEVRGSMAQDQELSTVPATLNNIIGHWVSPLSYERGLNGSPSWWDPATGRVTVRRAGFFRVSFAGLMIRTNAGAAGGTQQGHAYAGITITRAAGTIDGTAYPSMVGVLRTGESPVYGNGKDQDFVFSGEYFGPLGVGDQIWIRVIVSNVPDNGYALNRLYVKDDGRSHFTVVEEPSYSLI